MSLPRRFRTVMSPDDVKAKQDEIQRKKEADIPETLWSAIEKLLVERAKEPEMIATFVMDEIVQELAPGISISPEQIDLVCKVYRENGWHIVKSDYHYTFERKK